jgi:hypothetical protein
MASAQMRTDNSWYLRVPKIRVRKHTIRKADNDKAELVWSNKSVAEAAVDSTE